jgi:hypothetical protein
MLDVVIASHDRFLKIESLMDTNKDIMSFDYSLGDSKIKLILLRLMSNKGLVIFLTQLK